MDPSGRASREEGDRLLRLCAAGDSAALSPLVELYRERIFRLAYRMLGDAADAEEAVAAALVKVWSGAADFRGDCAADTWVYRIAFRATLDIRRGRRRWWRRFLSLDRAEEPKREPTDAAPGPERTAQTREDLAQAAAKLQQAVQKLNETDRALVHLFYYEGKGLPEIETILGISRPTLKVRLSRARERLRKLLVPQ